MRALSQHAATRIGPYSSVGGAWACLSTCIPLSRIPSSLRHTLLNTAGRHAGSAVDHPGVCGRAGFGTGRRHIRERNTARAAQVSWCSELPENSSVRKATIQHGCCHCIRIVKSTRGTPPTTPEERLELRLAAARTSWVLDLAAGAQDAVRLTAIPEEALQLTRTCSCCPPHLASAPGLTHCTWGKQNCESSGCATTRWRRCRKRSEACATSHLCPSPETL